MNYAAALVFVILSAVFLIAGFAASAPAAFVLAIVASALAVALLFKRLLPTARPHVFVTSAPPRIKPAWSAGDAPGLSEFPVDLEIDHVIDGYRSLVAAEILPILETLSTDELRKVLHVEREGRNRQPIIHRIEEIIALTEGPGRSRTAVVDPEAPVARRSPPRRRKVAAAAVEKPAK